MMIDSTKTTATGIENKTTVGLIIFDIEDLASSKPIIRIIAATASADKY